MQVFVIENAEMGIDEGFHVVAVRSTLELAEAYIRTRGKLKQWLVHERPGQPISATAYVWVGSRRRGSEYVFSVHAYDLE